MWHSSLRSQLNIAGEDKFQVQVGMGSWVAVVALESGLKGCIRQHVRVGLTRDLPAGMCLGVLPGGRGHICLLSAGWAGWVKPYLFYPLLA